MDKKKRMEPMALDPAPFLDCIRENCGFVFEGSRENALMSGVGARMKELGITDPKAYHRLLMRDRLELNKLVNYITVNETYFFREGAHFTLLADRLLPELRRSKPPGSRVKILSAGCSSGEEPYSAVIALRERFGPRIRDMVKVHAVDIDTAALEAARAGVYGRPSFREIPEGIKKKYFEDMGGERFRIRASVREMVEFQPLNLNSHSYPSHLHGMDIVFYRNVSIYFRAETQKAIFRRIEGIMAKDGYMFVSAPETPLHNIGILRLTEIDGTFLYRKFQ